MELAEDIIHDRLLLFHGEHPDTEFPCVILLPELGAGKSQKGQTDLISPSGMILLCDRHCLIRKKRRVSHLDRCLQAILMGSLLLKPENVQRFIPKIRPFDVLLLPAAGHLLGILRRKLRTVDNIDNKVAHGGTSIHSCNVTSVPPPRPGIARIICHPARRDGTEK